MEARQVSRDKAARKDGGMRQGVHKEGEAMSFREVIQEVEVRANLEAETEEMCIDQSVDPFYIATEHIIRGQL